MVMKQYYNFPLYSVKEKKQSWIWTFRSFICEKLKWHLAIESQFLKRGWTFNPQIMFEGWVSGMVKMLITLLNFCFLDPVFRTSWHIKLSTQFTTERLMINHTQGQLSLYYANRGLAFEQAFQRILHGRGQLRIDEEVLFLGLNL